MIEQTSCLNHSYLTHRCDSSFLPYIALVRHICTILYLTQAPLQSFFPIFCQVGNNRESKKFKAISRFFLPFRAMPKQISNEIYRLEQSFSLSELHLWGTLLAQSFATTQIPSIRWARLHPASQLHHGLIQRQSPMNTWSLSAASMVVRWCVEAASMYVSTAGTSFATTVSINILMNLERLPSRALR